jgi:ATP-dependent Clp protease ATP-binding subunit ClpA
VFDRFTDRARRVLMLAQHNAVEMGHTWIGCEHILLGLAMEGTGVAAVVLGQAGIDADRIKAAIEVEVGVQSPSSVSALDALATIGIDLDEVRRRVEESFGEGALTSNGRPPFTPKAKAALERAIFESGVLGHGYIGTEHLLLALLSADDGNVGTAILSSLAAEVDLRAETLALAAVDHLRIKAAEAKQGLLYQLTFNPDTAEVATALYEEVTSAIATARVKLVRAQVALTKTFADEIEAAVAAIEPRAAELGIPLTA